MKWLLRRAGPSGFSFSSTAEEVTHGIDASHLTAIVTGASSGIRMETSSGIGMETARVLALRGAHVILAIRNVTAGNAVKEKIIHETGNIKVDVLELDLSSLSSVQNFDSNFKSLNLPINILINNAGVFGCPYEFSKDGIELQFATNHLGHFFLTNLLLDIMKDTSQKNGIQGRIVAVSSVAHKCSYQGGIRLNRINEKEGYSSFLAYGHSKLANILHANELARRSKEEGSNLTVNSVHPGGVPTNLARPTNFLEFMTNCFENPLRTIQFVLKTTEIPLKMITQGAATQCYVAMHPKVKGINGKYFVDNNEGTPSPLAADIEMGRRLWKLSEDLVSSYLSNHEK